MFRVRKRLDMEIEVQARKILMNPCDIPVEHGDRRRQCKQSISRWRRAVRNQCVSDQITDRRDRVCYVLLHDLRCFSDVFVFEQIKGQLDLISIPLLYIYLQGYSLMYLLNL